jgi:hypothetical protein
MSIITSFTLLVNHVDVFQTSFPTVFSRKSEFFLRYLIRRSHCVLIRIVDITCSTVSAEFPLIQLKEPMIAAGSSIGIAPRFDPHELAQPSGVDPNSTSVLIDVIVVVWHYLRFGCASPVPGTYK